MPRITTPKGLQGGQQTLARFLTPKQKDGSENCKSSGNMTTPIKVGTDDMDAEKVRPMKRKVLCDTFDEANENKVELSDEAEAVQSEKKAALTPDILNAIKDKEMAAKILRVSKEFPIVDVNIGKTWYQALEPEFKKDYFAALNRFVMASRTSKTVYPPMENVWEWTKQVPIRDIKVVILGQDPYHGPNQAHGLCFSVKKGIPPPPSLVNMYKELATDVPDFKAPGHGCLSGWAEQGVLLLNAVLTVERGNANSHKDKGWEKVTDAVVRWISANSSRVVFFLWGGYAKKKGSFVDKKKHLVLEGPHPSPLSAYQGFFGCKHFSKCNEYLEKHCKKPIDWNHLP